MAGLLQARQSRVRRRFRAVAVEQVAEDVRRNVLALRRDVRVDVELEVAAGRQRARAVDRAVQQVGEPEQVVLLAYCPVEVYPSFRAGVFARCACLVIFGRREGNAAAVSRAGEASASWFRARDRDRP